MVGEGDGFWGAISAASGSDFGWERKGWPIDEIGALGLSAWWKTASAVRFGGTTGGGKLDSLFERRWWAELDSNQRRQSQQIYSLPPLAAWVSARFLREEWGVKAGRGLLQMDSLRTGDCSDEVCGLM